MLSTCDRAREFAFNAHNSTNHFYDGKIPYTFHLELVIVAYNKFVGMYFSDHNDRVHVKAACWLHDTIEDTRTNYSALYQAFGTPVADTVYAVTNEKGKSRAERASDAYYAGIRANKQAVFVKLCDRLANVGYSKLTQSGMFSKYQKENDEFLEKIGAVEHGFTEMVDYLKGELA